MTGETLLPCWSCGSDHVGPTGGMNIIMCGNCGAGPDEPWVWQSRALGPALDRVIAEVEAMDDAELAAVSKAYRQSGVAMDMPVGRLQTQILAMLRALRAEQSAGAGGETGGGS